MNISRYEAKTIDLDVKNLLEIEDVILFTTKVMFSNFQESGSETIEKPVFEVKEYNAIFSPKSLVFLGTGKDAKMKRQFSFKDFVKIHDKDSISFCFISKEPSGEENYLIKCGG